MKDTNMQHGLALYLLVAATPAMAWTITTERDPMTDKSLSWARVTTQDATLLVGCLNGHPQPRLTWSAPIGKGDIGVTYRFDDGPVVPRMAMVSRDGTMVYPWIMDYASAIARLKNGKRLRVQISGGRFYDFDLKAGGQELPVIKC